MLNKLCPNYSRFEYNQDDKQLKLKYETALSRLPEKQRTVFLMSRNEELKYAEIAERLDISVKTVEKRMSAVLAYLRKVLTV
jgi:RNA polymerase sigma-70 factor (ECF subfamily)